MQAECASAAQMLLRSRHAGSLRLRLGCGEPLHGRLQGATAHRPQPPAPPGLERAPA
jgi:hypothetical protein